MIISDPILTSTIPNAFLLILIISLPTILLAILAALSFLLSYKKDAHPASILFEDWIFLYIKPAHKN